MTAKPPLDPIQAANEERNPILRSLRIHIREPKVRAIEIHGNRLHKGRHLTQGERLIVLDTKKLPPGFILAEDAASLLENRMATAITESQLQAEEAA